MTTDEMTARDAMSLVFGDLDRQGPGDEALIRAILATLPDLPPAPAVADLGCGTGSSSLVLADELGTVIRCVDVNGLFLSTLQRRAEAAGLARFVQTVEADMASRDWLDGELDLLWSEGAAYNITFKGAHRAWRPMLTTSGLAVISEMGWFGEERPDEAHRFWQGAYPAMATEEENREVAEEEGFRVLDLHRLPNEAWWRGYYEPLGAKLDELSERRSDTLATVIEETRQEIELFRRHGHAYGYTFHVLQAG